MKVVYLVQRSDIDAKHEPVYAVFADADDAMDFVAAAELDAEVVERTVWYGQPNTPGFNH